MNGETKILIHEALLMFLKGTSIPDPSEARMLQLTLDGYITSMASHSPVDAIIESFQDRKTLIQLSAKLGLANDPQLRTALRVADERVAALLVSIFSSGSDEEDVLSLEGEAAQCFLDVVQETLDKGLLPAKEHSRMAHRIIRKLSEACDRLPSSLFITEVSEREEYPTFGGGYGDIYRASHGNRPVALKRMRQFIRGSDLRRIRSKFCREALVWKDLDHPHILQFLGIDRDSFPSGLCMVSPWMEHGTVVHYLRTHGRENVDRLLYEVSQGLHYLHSCNIIHGDLRGANILIKEDWSACLADFGLSMFSDATSTRSTNRGGSLYWMAPELLDPDRFGLTFARTPATDVYAFGCVCFELYTGRPPFANLSEPAALMKVLNGERPERPLGPPAMSDKLWQDVKEFWADDAAARPLTELVVQKMLWPSAEPQASRPLPLLPPSRSATPPTGLTPYTFSFPESSPNANNSPSAELFDDVIPPEDDLRRLSNECKIGVGNATVLGDALSTAAPEQLNDPVIAEFYKKCIDSQEVISTQIQWASAAAERSHIAEDDPGRTHSNSELTREEILLADLLTANEQLVEALRLYHDLEALAFDERLVEERGWRDLDSDPEKPRYSMVAATPPYSAATSMSRAESPSPLSQPLPSSTTHNRRSHDANRDSAESANTPLTPFQRYVGWVAEAVAPLEEFIDESVDPRDFYCDLREIAHTESGSVLAAALVPDAPIHRLKLPPPVKARDAQDMTNGRRVLVAMKCLALLPGENTQVLSLRRECELLRGLWCEQVLGMDALYVDLVEDALWIRSELMEGRLTDMIRRIPDGLRLQEPPVMARLASDMLHALVYLQGHSIAHRDLRSENLFINGEGVLKVAGFSNAVRVTPLATDVVAPEFHDSLKFDVWCVGAIVWEMAEAASPLFDPRPAARLPPVNKLYPAWLQDFLNLCFEPALFRPSPKELLEAFWIQRACGRPIIKRLVSSFRSIGATRPAGVTPSADIFSFYRSLARTD